MRNAALSIKTTGIPMTRPMVLATLDGSKTETRRRVVLRDPTGTYSDFGDDGWPESADECGDWHRDPCPFGGVGDRLLVTEAHRWLRVSQKKLHVHYDADHEVRTFALDDLPDELAAKARAYTRWESLRPSRFMHHAISRLPLEVTSVRVERLQEITNEGAAREGCTWDRAEQLIPLIVGCRRMTGRERMTSRMVFAEYWNSIYEASSHGWEKDDRVWVVAYRRAQL
jgi:hypothetical protein